MAEALTDRVRCIQSAPVAPRTWGVAFAAAAVLGLLLPVSLLYLLAAGVGIWGVNVPVSWGFAIVNFVWWIGIAHAGTLISAILLLLRQGWRTGLSRFAETMTVFAVPLAALFPLIHLGRPWLFYWVFPYPGPTGTWPQFRSPLIWDVFAIGTYGIVSFLLWYTGMVPDFAVLRDRTRNGRARKVYAALALGWRGQADHWQRYQTGYRLVAGLATALVVSVHSIVSYDFAVSILPGWHSTVFPPYFVAGAIFSGFAMLFALLIPARAVCGLSDVITAEHLDNMAKVMLAAGLVVTYGWCVELFAALYTGSPFERTVLAQRLGGTGSPAFWALLLANVAAPQLLWSHRARRSGRLLFGVALGVVAGMWLERYGIVITSLQRDFLPASWGEFSGTLWDWATLAGSGGLFVLCMLVFLRCLPPVSMIENGLGGGRVHAEQAEDAPGRLTGVLAEFRTPEDLVQAVEALKSGGYRMYEAYTPVPVPGLSADGSLIPRWALLGGMLGAAGGFLLQYWVSTAEAASKVGGRPLNSWQAFLPVTLECAILFAVLATVISVFAGSGLPRPHHPVFGAPSFGIGYEGHYYVSVSVRDPLFDRAEAQALLKRAGAHEVVDLAA